VRIPLPFLGNYSLNNFSCQRIHVTIENFWKRSFLSGSFRIKWESVGQSVYPPMVARQRFCKHIPAVMKNCWKCRFLWGPCHIKESRRLILPRTLYYVLFWHWKCELYNSRGFLNPMGRRGNVVIEALRLHSYFSVWGLKMTWTVQPTGIQARGQTGVNM
jgi:hypothetical protein